jgi:hypothetical protein
MDGDSRPVCDMPGDYLGEVVDLSGVIADLHASRPAGVKQRCSAVFLLQGRIVHLRIPL